MNTVKEIERLTIDLELSRNGEVYYATKYAKWKEHATVNRIGNFHLAENYLNLESFCEGLKKQLLRYQTSIYGKEAYKERGSTSVVRQVFPALPMRPVLVSSLYFAVEDRDDARLKQIIKATYRFLEKDVIGDEGSVVDVKGKCPMKLAVTRAYKNCVQELVDQKRGPKNVVVRY